MTLNIKDGVVRRIRTIWKPPKRGAGSHSVHLTPDHSNNLELTLDAATYNGP